MAKGSYFSKHKALIHGNSGGQKPVPVTDEQRAEFAEGKLLLIDKDLHWTSFDVVRKIRNAVKVKKVGHAGTLDPLATGLLIVCTGKFTKKINEYMAQPKTYTAKFTLGAVTPTYDLESESQDQKDISGLTEAQIRQATNLFLGEIMQVPPVYSAIKKDGVAAYELARRGTAVELEPRKISIYSFEVDQINLPDVYCTIRCSTGTYIRSLAHDFGQALGVGAYLSGLRRTQIGDFSVDDAATVSSFLQSLHANDPGDTGLIKKDS